MKINYFSSELNFSNNKYDYIENPTLSYCDNQFNNISPPLKADILQYNKIDSANSLINKFCENNNDNFYQLNPPIEKPHISFKSNIFKLPQNQIKKKKKKRIISMIILII